MIAGELVKRGDVLTEPSHDGERAVPHPRLGRLRNRPRPFAELVLRRISEDELSGPDERLAWDERTAPTADRPARCSVA